VLHYFEIKHGGLWYAVLAEPEDGKRALVTTLDAKLFFRHKTLLLSRCGCDESAAAAGQNDGQNLHFCRASSAHDVSRFISEETSALVKNSAFDLPLSDEQLTLLSEKLGNLLDVNFGRSWRVMFAKPDSIQAFSSSGSFRDPLIRLKLAEIGWEVVAW